MTRESTTYLLARLPIGMSFLGHGLQRLPILAKFSAGMVNSFSKSFIPGALVQPFSLGLPFVELLLGILLLLGLFTRFATISGVIVMLALIFGSTSLGQWDNVFIQLMYSAYLALLYYFLPYNTISVDGWRKK
ncbi:DoxX family membrane protein [Mucilaginibacter sp. E4BP6]|uniref:DoxX family membrane protein n=1 Tax=Mucilaginibacter sp. E4BP6 TaxID=2723089 RepID=UPI0015CDCAFF|nr:DoxX family membrane protein [Mucilaginibacter sp. E4BP6]NYE68218.1 thiosulfate dehydrogenase [quinone] large subunit [Mucilaginibacter sp. E4BP6]